MQNNIFADDLPVFSGPITNLSI